VVDVTLFESLLQASLNTEDPQYQEKRMVAQRNGKLAIQNFNVRTFPPSFCSEDCKCYTFICLVESGLCR